MTFLNCLVKDMRLKLSDQKLTNTKTELTNITFYFCKKKRTRMPQSFLEKID